MILFFDTETTGLPKNWKAPVNDITNWPRLVQIAWLKYDYSGNLIESENHIIKPEGYSIPLDSSKIHGITTEKAISSGEDLQTILTKLVSLLKEVDYLVAHNMSFDEKIIGAEFIRKDIPNTLFTKKRICTMMSTTDYCAIQGNYGNKWPKLSELHEKIFGNNFEEAHDASIDIMATAKCFWELQKRQILFTNIGKDTNITLPVITPKTDDNSKINFESKYKIILDEILNIHKEIIKTDQSYYFHFNNKLPSLFSPSELNTLGNDFFPIRTKIAIALFNLSKEIVINEWCITILEMANEIKINDDNVKSFIVGALEEQKLLKNAFGYENDKPTKDALEGLFLILSKINLSFRLKKQKSIDNQTTLSSVRVLKIMYLNEEKIQLILRSTPESKSLILQQLEFFDSYAPHSDIKIIIKKIKVSMTNNDELNTPLFSIASDKLENNSHFLESKGKGCLVLMLFPIVISLYYIFN